MPRSEAVCDQPAPAPVGAAPTTEPEKSAWVSALLGLYEAEVDKWLVSQPCREQVRGQNLRAYGKQ